MRRESVTEHKHGGLRELPATAICGNDITSSCLYVSALAILQAGKWAWLVLLFVAGVLFLFRKIYSEVVGALPLKGRCQQCAFKYHQQVPCFFGGLPDAPFLHGHGRYLSQ